MKRREPRRSRTLGGISRHVDLSHGVRRSDLRPDDELTVYTRNSVYRIRPGGAGRYLVEGGWFRRECEVEIRGCTWGGPAICVDLLSAPGLFLEFGNSVRTTRIQSVIVAPRRPTALPN